MIDNRLTNWANNFISYIHDYGILRIHVLKVLCLFWFSIAVTDEIQRGSVVTGSFFALLVVVVGLIMVNETSDFNNGRVEAINKRALSNRDAYSGFFRIVLIALMVLFVLNFAINPTTKAAFRVFESIIGVAFWYGLTTFQRDDPPGKTFFRRSEA